MQLLHIPALIALILSITGGTSQFSSDASEHGDGQTNTRAGIILFLVVYICLFILSMVTFSDVRIMPQSQKRIFVCVLIALPLIAVRLLYSLIGDFSSDPENQFSIVYGSPRIQLAMATIEELLVVVMFAILGVLTPRAVPTARFDDQQGLELNSKQCSDVEYGPGQMSYARNAAQIALNGQRANN